MKYVKYSDLPFKAVGDSILLCQPVTTVQAGVCPQSGWNREFLEEAFKDSIGLSGLIHVGSLSCDSSNDELGGPYALGPQCGGCLHLRQTKTVSSLCNAETEVAIVCNGSGCNMEVTVPECPTRGDLSNLLLHLMLKQMVPGLPVANYVDCGKKEDNSLMKEGDGKAIRKLGLISLASEALWGNVDNGYYVSYGMTSRFSLGFMLTPGMDTSTGLKEYHRSLAPLLLGPKLSQKK